MEEINKDHIQEEALEKTMPIASWEQDGSSGFKNEQVRSQHLPSIGEIVFEPLEKNHLYVNYIVTFILFLMLLAATVIACFFIESIREYMSLAIITSIVIFGLLFIAEYRSFTFKGFALREKDLLYRTGWLWKSTSVVPFNRIQHMEVNQGPIDRMFDLGTITVFTAGGSSSDLEIDGILYTKATMIKEYIINKNKGIEDGSDE